MADLLFQRQDDPVEVVWCGRAGDYLNTDLQRSAARWPAHAPSAEEAEMHNEPREPRQAHNKQIVREQRIARGICGYCPNPLRDSDGDHIRCRPCRLKVAARANQPRDQRLGRCSRCHRRPREMGCGLWCRLCWNSAAQRQSEAPRGA